MNALFPDYSSNTEPGGNGKERSVRWQGLQRRRAKARRPFSPEPKTPATETLRLIPMRRSMAPYSFLFLSAVVRA